MKMRKRILLFLGVIMILLIGSGVFGFYFMMNQAEKKVESIAVEPVDLTQIADGEYIGSYDATLIYAKVKVTVASGTIEKIEILEHKTKNGKPAERLAEDIVVQQSLMVDDISGATGSSKVIKKAVDNALHAQQ